MFVRSWVRMWFWIFMMLLSYRWWWSFMRWWVDCLSRYVKFLICFFIMVLFKIRLLRLWGWLIELCEFDGRKCVESLFFLCLRIWWMSCYDDWWGMWVCWWLWVVVGWDYWEMGRVMFVRKWFFGWSVLWRWWCVFRGY